MLAVSKYHLAQPGIYSREKRSSGSERRRIGKIIICPGAAACVTPIDWINPTTRIVSVSNFGWSCIFTFYGGTLALLTCDVQLFSMQAAALMVSRGYEDGFF